MKRLLTAAAAALALTATAASADPYGEADDMAYVDQSDMSGPVYDSPSEGTSYQFQPGGWSTAPGFYAQNETEAMERTPNLGAGTSRSSSANNG